MKISLENLYLDKVGAERAEGDMSQGYCCFKSILCGSHNYLVIHKMIR